MSKNVNNDVSMNLPIPEGSEATEEETELLKG